MGDILSQSEIDALLNQMISGGDDGGGEIVAPASKSKDARPYDFANPSKFNREQLRTLENIFDNFARSTSSFLTGYLRTAAHLEVSSSEEIMYRDFNVALANPVILSMIELSPLKGTVICDMSSNVGYAIIDRILGGPGFGISKMRDFSEIEKILLERVMLQILSFLPEPWEGVLPIRPRLEKIETNTQFAQIISPTDKVALIVLTIKVGTSEGNISFCLPHRVLEPIVDRLYTRFWYGQKEEENKEMYRERLEIELERAKIPVSVQVGKSRINVNEFINLQVGDIIPLDSYVNTDVEVLIGKMHKFYAKPGISRGKFAVQITDLIEKEETNNG
ncbi:MAG: flagellar motor switch protein FliM [Defluviitaleaceae bacterium]|nr:flagellar motor switch protein FliM [Defluviitaleaceae bacterium]